MSDTFIEVNMEIYNASDGTKCSECGSHLVWSDIADAIKKYGLIVLVRGDSGYFGINCPKCTNTMMYETDRKFLEFLCAGKVDTEKGFMVKRKNFKKAQEVKLAYNFAGTSFFYIASRFFKIEKKEEIIPSFQHMIEHTQNFHTDSEGDLADWKKVYSNHLCSFLFPSYAAGPMSIITWPFPGINSEKEFYKAAEYMDISDEEDLRVITDGHSEQNLDFLNGDDIPFPRNIDEWDDENEAFVDDIVPELFSDYDIEPLSISDEKHLISLFLSKENSTGKKLFPRYIIFDQFYFSADDFSSKYAIGHDEHLMGTISFFESSEKYLQRKNLEFLYLLDFPHTDENMGASDEDNISANRFHFESSSLPISTELNIGLHKCAKTSEKIWSEYNKDYLQELLTAMSDNFIDEYLDLTSRIDCTYDLIWQLKDKYLSNLVKAIESRTQRKRIRDSSLKLEMERIEKISTPYPSLKKIISIDKKINRIKALLASKPQSVPKNVNFMLLGETGTGKELFARAIHETSGRTGDFIVVNCSAIPDDLFEGELFGYVKGIHSEAKSDRIGLIREADGGTLFFDEIGDLSIRHQPKLFRVLQERKVRSIGGKSEIDVDVRFVFATNKDIPEMIDENRFREELYYRINQRVLIIPPLRKRQNDIPLLLDHFIELSYQNNFTDDNAEAPRFSPEAIAKLKRYHWPGNVRELQSFVINIPINIPDKVIIEAMDLPNEVLRSNSRKRARSMKTITGRERPEYTDEEIIEAMKVNNNNKSRAAKYLGCSWPTINKRWNNIQNSGS